VARKHPGVLSTAATCAGEQQESTDTSTDTLPIALRKGTREAAMKDEAERKALREMHDLQTFFDGHDIGNFVSYESLSPS
jgi:hypothetical protein